MNITQKKSDLSKKQLKNLIEGKKFSWKVEDIKKKEKKVNGRS